ncbi:MAG: hypothetical protein ACK5N9_26555 [Pirellula sp.]
MCTPPVAKAKASFVELVIQDRFDYADDRPLVNATMEVLTPEHTY